MKKEITKLLGAGLLILCFCPLAGSCIGFIFGLANVRSISGLFLALIGILVAWILQKKH